MKTTRLSCALSVASSRTAGTSSTWQSMATILIVLRQSSIDTLLHSTVLTPALALLVQQLCEGSNFRTCSFSCCNFFCGENRPISLNVLLLSKVCSHASNAFMTNFAFMGDCEQAEPTLSHSLEVLRGKIIIFPKFQTCEPKFDALPSGARRSCRTHLTSTSGASSRLPQESGTYVLSPHNRSRLWREALCQPWAHECRLNVQHKAVGFFS